MSKTHYKSLVAAAIFTGLSQQAAMATELDKIYSSQDTWVNINHGGKEANMRGDKADMKIDDNFTAFVQFVIPPLPTGEVIDKVMLEMKVTGLNPIPDAYISELTDPAVIWDETAVTEPSWPFEIGEKIPGASIVSDPNSDPSTWILQKGEKYQFDITSAVTGAGTYTFNVDSEFSTKAAGILDRKFGAGVYSKDLATQLGRPALIITTKPTPDITAPVISIPADITVAATDDTGTADTAAELANFLTAATANDAIDGIIAVSHDAPAVFPLGETTVTFEASDTSENTATMEATVTITDQTPPIIALVGDNAPTLSTGDIYSEQGATAQDNVEGDISVDVIIGGDIVNTTTPGTYTVTYNLTDLAGNVANELTRQVTVQDASAPVVNVPDNISVAATDQNGTNSLDSSISTFLTKATANDDVDGSVNVTHNAPNPFPIGETVVTFSAKDSSDNIGTSQAKVTISDQTSPVITLVGDSAITVNLGDSYVEPGFSALDNVDYDISSKVTISGDTIDTNAEGIYTITYNTSDIAGNAALEKTRKITVQDIASPTVSAPENITVAATDHLGTADSDASISDFLAAATANDIIDGEISVTHNAPTLFPIGITTVSFSAIDSDNKTGIAQATVSIIDQDAPVITLAGEDSITLYLNQAYNEAGYSAEDNVDGDISANVVVDGDIVNTTTTGTYTVTYNLADLAGNNAVQLTRQINVIIEPNYDDSNSAPNDDNDGDGVADINDAFPNDATESVDTDGDGTGDNTDIFPNDASETTDSDGDGMGDNADVFPNDVSETTDTDLDGMGDNADVFPNDASETTDTDLDGTGDNADFAPDDASETTDSDGDGMGDNADAFPNDGSETTDTDFDGTGDNADFAPDDASETTDSDGDGMGDNADVFPNDGSETTDTDGDKIGNNTDNDDDNDGIIDADDIASLDPAIGDSQAPNIADTEALTIEATGEFTEISLIAPLVTDNNLNAPSIVANLAKALPLGEHKITWTATDFAGNTTTTEQLITLVDTTAPEFDELTTKTINARGLLTDISADINVMASDLVDGELSATLTGALKYRAGSQKVTLMVTDSSGNTSSAEQVIHINPIVEMARGVNLAPGSHYVLPVTLSDKAAVYPVTISYALSGAVTGETITENNGEIVIDSGLVGEVEFKISEQAIENDLVTVTLLSANNAVIAETSSLFTVIETNIAPTVTLSVEQNGQSVSIIDATAGVVTVTATVSDTNYLDKHNVSWSVADSAIMDLSADNSDLTFEFSPEQLNSGTYGLSLSVAENNTDELFVINIDSSLFVATALVVLSNEADSDNDGIADSDEGYSDSDGDGIADYLDNDNNVSRLPSSDGAEPMQTVKGLVLSLGDIVRQAGNASAGDASINLDELAENGGENGESADNATNTNFTPVSNILNFNVSGLSYTGESVPVVIPLAENQFIPQDAVYKKYSLAKGWFDFVVDENNTISSAMINSDGNCPAPLSDVYLAGLQAGDNCIQLLIEDGGENDADKQANGVIKDPGVLAVDGPNEAPVLSMLSPLNVNENTLVTLDASSSTDADNNVLSYRWMQTSGADVDLIGQDSAVLSFTAPTVTSKESLNFSLAVNDGDVTVTKEFTITVSNVVELIAQINAHDAQISESTLVELTANENISYDGEPSYLWQQVSGPEISLLESDASAATIKFNAPEVTKNEVVEFTLTVSHGDVEVSTTTSLTVTNVETKQSGGSVTWLLAFGALLLRRQGINFLKATMPTK